MSPTPSLDWKALDEHLVTSLFDAVRSHHVNHPVQRIYGAAFHVFYGETGGVVAWPLLGIASEEDLESIAEGSNFAPEELRWSPADWSTQIDPTHADDAWAQRIEAFASIRNDAHWEKVYDRYLRACAKAAKKARARLVSEGIVEKSFIAVAMDEAWELVPLSLTAAQVRAHFPELDEEAQELARLDQLPPAKRAAALADILDSHHGGVVSSEIATRLLKGLGADAVSVAVERMPRSADRWRWAKLLADVGIADPAAVDALSEVLLARRLTEPDRAWAAAALVRLGQLDRVLAERERLPREVFVRGLAAPFTSFRDHAVSHLPLDYSPLEQVLADDEELANEVLVALSPGSGYCTIEPAEIATAQLALGSAIEVVRRHASIVLEDAGRL